MLSEDSDVQPGPPRKACGGAKSSSSSSFPLFQRLRQTLEARNRAKVPLCLRSCLRSRGPLLTGAGEDSSVSVSASQQGK